MGRADPSLTATQESDAQLIDAWTVARDETALETLFSRYQPTVRGTARRFLRDKDLVEDVIQETFIKLADQADTITGPVEGWLRRVAGNLALMQLRSQGRRQERDAKGSAELTSRSCQDQDDGHHQDLVAECIAGLSPGERDLVIRIFWEGLPQKELAREGNVSAVTIHKRTQAALDSLRRMMRRRGVHVGAAALVLSLVQLSGNPAPPTAWILARPPFRPGLGMAIAASVAVAGVAVATLLLTRAVGGSGPDAPSAPGGGLEQTAPPQLIGQTATPAAPAETAPDAPPEAPADRDGSRFDLRIDAVIAVWGMPEGDGDLARLKVSGPVARDPLISLGLATTNDDGLTFGEPDRQKVRFPGEEPAFLDAVVVKAPAAMQQKLLGPGKIDLGGSWLRWTVVAGSLEMKTGSRFMAHAQMSYRMETGSWVDQLQWEFDLTGKPIEGTMHASSTFVGNGQMQQTLGIGGRRRVFIHFSEIPLSQDMAAAMHQGLQPHIRPTREF